MPVEAAELNTGMFALGIVPPPGSSEDKGKKDKSSDYMSSMDAGKNIKDRAVDAGPKIDTYGCESAPNDYLTNQEGHPEKGRQGKT